METLVINISWEYFLGIIGGLVTVAYYANGRFTALETNVEWLKEMLTDLLVNAENEKAKVFRHNSAVSLTARGYHALARSGLRSYIDANRKRLLSQLIEGNSSVSYELQRRAFRLLTDLSLEAPVARSLDTYAFANGISTTLLRRVGAIYLCDTALQSD